MIVTILLLTLVLLFFVFLVFTFIKQKLTNPKTVVLILISLVCIVLLFLYTGFGKFKSDISRLIHNSGPKKAEEVYTLLFKKPTGGCLSVINFKDQVIPKIDCCIWMEVRLCPTELVRIINLKKYKEEILFPGDSLLFLNSFDDRPSWWSPQALGKNITKLNIKFDKDNEQTLFFGKDSSHVYLCDQAL